MSEAPRRQSKPSVQADIWTFNLRSTKTNDADSDSDSNDDEDAPTNSVFESEEARLLKDLDLSSREETVVYKPNPFSIAKINAASRNRSTPTIDRRPAKPAPKKPQGRIVDSFNVKKKEKKPSHPSGSRPKVTSASANAIPRPRPTSINPTLSPDSTTPAYCIPPVDAPNLSAVGTPTIAEKILSPLMTEARTRHVLPLTTVISPHTSTVVPAVPHVPFQTVGSKKKFRPPAPISFSSPFKPASLEVRCTTNSNQYPGNRISFSSPLRPTQPTLLSPISGNSVSNNLLPRSKYPPRKLNGTSQMQVNPASYQHRTITNEPKLAPAPEFQHSPTRSNVSLTRAPQPHHMLTPSSSTHLHAFPPNNSAAVFAHSQPLLTSTFHPNAEHPEIHSFTFEGRRPVRQHDLNLLHQLPASSPIMSPTATPSPSPRRKRESARKRLSPNKSTRTLKRQTSDAYNYFRSDPDDDWSTLPTRKKSKASDQIKPRINGVRTTAAFRLPGTSTKAKVTGMSAASARRVVTFLPPPLKSGKVEVLVEDARPGVGQESPLLDVDGVSPRALKHSRESSPPLATPKRRRLSENPYPSPANSRLTPGDVTTVVDDLPGAAPSKFQSSPAIQRPAYRIPSPPTSDPPPEYDMDVPAVVTVGAVSQRYPQTKGLVRQVRFGFKKSAMAEHWSQ
ncbi:hypothetical protein DFH09DRAFT_292924 [Mycena vulgaris]|nr:hypothetical protein DFH09DRAFT_292924 [Mycena vulgaris]